MKYILGWVLLCWVQPVSGQELFVFTEPASNMASHSIGARLTNVLMNDDRSNRLNLQVMPEVMWGVSKKWMLHLGSYLSNRDGATQLEGANFYAKYRLYSNDDIHSHFRMALFGRAAFNNSLISQAAIDLKGFNSGYEAGMIATQLLNKVAISATAGWLHALNNGNNKFTFNKAGRDALEYSISVGKLLLPKNYTNYSQVNLNAMLELLGQCNLGNQQQYLDLAPSLQLIFDSKTRVDVGYRFPVTNHLYRMSNNSWLIRFEFNFFNVFK